jgi:hypothetical protein
MSAVYIQPNATLLPWNATDAPGTAPTHARRSLDQISAAQEAPSVLLELRHDTRIVRVLLVSWWNDPYSPFAVRRLWDEALPEIERLLLALPPFPDGGGTSIANVMRRP